MSATDILLTTEITFSAPKCFRLVGRDGEILLDVDLDAGTIYSKDSMTATEAGKCFVEYVKNSFGLTEKQTEGVPV